MRREYTLTLDSNTITVFTGDSTDGHNNSTLKSVGVSLSKFQLQAAIFREACFTVNNGGEGRVACESSLLIVYPEAVTTE